MPNLQTTLRDRWALAWTDPVWKKRVLRLLILLAGGAVSWLLNGWVCGGLPDAFEPACHEAATFTGKIARWLAVGGG